MAYNRGKALLGDAEFDALKLRLKQSGSIITAQGPRCSLRSKKMYSDAAVDYLRLLGINIPAALLVRRWQGPLGGELVQRSAMQQQRMQPQPQWQEEQDDWHRCWWWLRGSSNPRVGERWAQLTPACLPACQRPLPPPYAPPAPAPAGPGRRG